MINHNLTKGEVREEFLKDQVKEQFESVNYHKGIIVDNIDFILALDRNKADGEESKDFFLIKDVYSNRFVLKKKEPVSKDFFMLFSNV